MSLLTDENSSNWAYIFSHLVNIGIVKNRCEIHAKELTVSVSIVKLYTCTFVYYSVV
jgi:hypothetical protein